MGINIPTIYFRSSSLGNHEFCQMQYFIQYVLGHKAPANQKAQLGTIVHKTMEILANCKKQLQENPNRKASFKYIDPELGTINWKKSEFVTEQFVNDLCWKSFLYYSSKCIHEYTEKDFNFCLDLCKVITDQYSGIYDPRNSKILDPEPFFDIPIEEDWAKFTYEGKSYQLAIKGTIDLVTELDEETIEVRDYKGLPLETKLLTPDGWTTMGEVVVGDTLYDKDGNETIVTGKSKVKYKDCYRILFDDTSEVECDDEHIWLLSNGKEVQIKDLKIKDNIDTAKVVKYDNKPLPIDPYVLGVWLGDGRNRCGEICGNDEFIFEEIQRRGYKIGKDISGGGKRCPSHTIISLTTELRKLGLLNNKHIPNIYKKSSFTQRLDLVRGLMDSDGYANPIRKQGHFVNCNKKLSQDFKEVLLSLGQRPYLKELKKNGFGLTVSSYDIFFRPININPFLLPRKANVIKSEWGPGKSNKRQIKEIIPIGKKYTQCIMVDSPSKTYLCTENMIPTHNTGQRKDWATGEIKDYHKLMKDTQLLLYNYAISKLYPQYKHRILTIIFLRDGGPFSLSFEKEDEEEFLRRLRKKFYEISYTKMPKLCSSGRTSFKCTRLCHYYKTPFPGTEENICEHVENGIKTYGIKLAQTKLKASGFNSSNYDAPGKGN